VRGVGFVLPIDGEGDRRGAVVKGGVRPLHRLTQAPLHPALARAVPLPVNGEDQE
jgi:hypothetical protein